MPGVSIGPFQNIVNVGWGNPRVAMFILDVFVGASAEDSPPLINYDFNISVGGQGGEILRHKLVVNRAGATGAPPTISQIVSPAMLAHYAIWAYEPYELDDAVEHTSGDAFYFITTEIATFPDFVFSPYDSVEAAEAYLDEQASIHPEYSGQTFTINFQPAFNTFSQVRHYRQITFINLDAFAKDIAGNVEIGFTGASEPASGLNAEVNLFVGLYRGTTLLFPASPENNFLPNILAALFSSAAFYQFDAQDDDVAAIAGTILVHPDNPPSVTGPASPGGGGG